MREITDEILGKFDSTRHYAIENMADLNANHRKIADSNICFMERVKIANLRPVRSEKIARLDFDVTDLQGESVRGTFVYNSTQPKQEQEINSMRILTRSIYSQDSLVSIKFPQTPATFGLLNSFVNSFNQFLFATQSESTLAI